MKTKGLKFLLLGVLGILFSYNHAFTQGRQDVSEECLKNFSLYYEFYKHKNYKDALDPWRKLYNECPEWKESTFAYGVNIYRYYLNQAESAEDKAAYADTIMRIYDKRIEYFPKSKGDVLGRKGVDLLRYRRNDGPEYIKEGYETLKESVKIKGDNSSPVVLTTMISAGISLFTNGMLDGEDLINSYVTSSDILDKQLAKRPTSRTKKAKEAIDANIKDSRVMTCEAIANIYGPKFEENKDDLEYLKMLSGFLNDAGNCEMEPFYTKVNEQLYAKEPSAEAAYSLGRLFLKKEQYQKSKEYFLEAIELGEEDERKAQYLYSLAGLEQQYLKNPVKAVEYASRASDLDPDWGDPLILMGLAYIAGNMSLEDEFERRTSYWVAVD
ncbi:MAG: tetratricopeptide repeat protein, partial [Bacteroidota bacterium]